MKLRPVGLSVLLFLSVACVYLANGRTIGAGDTLPARYLPWSLLRDWSFHLDDFPFLYQADALRTFPLLDGVPYYLRYRDGHYLSAYSPGPALIALPVYGVPVLAGLPPTSPWAPHLEKLSATLITALSALPLFWAARELAGQRWALGIAVVYALGTSSLSVSSQGLWQHGPSQLFLALLLYGLVRGLTDERYLAYTGFAMAAAVVMRSTDVLIVLPVAGWILYTRRRIALRFILWALPPLTGLALYNVLHWGSLGGGAGNTTAPTWALFVQTPLLEGLSGLLVSPGRGLFVYSPVLLFSLLGMAWVWRAGPALLRPLTLGPLLVVLAVSKWFLWWGGHSYGPRLLADTAPILCFFLYPIGGYLDRRRLLKGVFCVLAGFSIGAHALGAFFYDGRWDGMAEVERHPSRLWSWKRGPLAFYGREAARVLGHLVSPAATGPTSADSPALLAALYAAAPVTSEVFAGEQIAVSLEATNTGRAVWLAAAPGDRGVVRLGWRWYAGERETAAGREPLRADVFPGQAARFAARILPPTAPGDYTLVLDLVSEGVTWFADRGSKPLRVSVRVRLLDLAGLLAAPMSANGPTPAVTIATDRRSYRRADALSLTVELSNPHRPRSFDAYLALQAPDGTVILYDGRRGVRATGDPWAPWVRNLPMPARVTGRFAVPLSMLPPGDYRWHVVVTAPKTYRVVARASTDFSVAP